MSKLPILLKKEMTSMNRTPNKSTTKPITKKSNSQPTINSSNLSIASNTKSALRRCKYCRRTFVPDRLVDHEQICLTASHSKRAVFDSSKFRVQGTEMENFVNFNHHRNDERRNVTKKSNWREVHKEFINTIREAKKVTQYLAKGGKITDLPPPEPSKNPDYIQCPHCNRRFNQAAGNRHIPKCADMLHNKPKNKPQPKSTISRRY